MSNWRDKLYNDAKSSMDQNYIFPRIEIEDKQIDDWLCCAFEGGINYWCNEIKVKDDDYKGAKYASDVISRGGVIIVNDYAPSNIKVTKSCILQALVWLSLNNYTKVLQRLLSGQYDAGDADILFQVACFHDVVYG
tara:strand:- start:834 stop:1241 length:408 start_codon:yes stop_codon:yes gene_type:complete